MKPLTETLSKKELDFLYWALVDYCETNIPQELPERANINRIYKKILNLNNIEEDFEPSDDKRFDNMDGVVYEEI